MQQVGPTITAEPGTFVYGPRGIPHGFRVEGSTPARMLVLTTPGKFMNFVLDLSEPAPPSGPPDLEHQRADIATYNVEILGPLDEVRMQQKMSKAT